ncbi:MAG: Yip1 family protein [Planctomycetota bacterium]
MTDENPYRFDDQLNQPANPFAAPQAVDEEATRELPPGELGLNPWVAILHQPRTAIRAIVDFNPYHQLLLVSIAGGGIAMFGMNDGSEDAANLPLGPLIATALIGGPIAGLLVTFVLGSIFKISASALGGTATYPEMWAAYAWTLAPSVWAAPGTLLTAIATSPDVVDRVGGAVMPLALLNTAAAIVAGVWSLVICVNTFAEVNRFSALRGFGTLMLPIVLIVAAMIALFAVLVN